MLLHRAAGACQTFSVEPRPERAPAEGMYSHIHSNSAISADSPGANPYLLTTRTSASCASS